MRADLFQFGSFRLASGAESDFKIDCDALSDAEIAGLASLVACMVPPFGKVEGVPTGGLRLAKALREYTRIPSVAGMTPLLIVDDVYTTGGSIERFRGDREAIGAVLFARRRIKNEHLWVRALFQMDYLVEMEY